MKYRLIGTNTIVEVITFNELVAHGRKETGETPWSFNYERTPITHENDKCYLIPSYGGGKVEKFTPGDMLVTSTTGRLYVVSPEDFIAHYKPEVVFRQRWEDAAAAASRMSPCAKSQRGVVIVQRNSDDPIVYAHNAPPLPFVCDGSAACANDCNRIAVHAEERAIIHAGESIWHCEMVHVKTVDGRPVPSGNPSCWQCSRMILESGISGVWLLNEHGWLRYSAEEFHRQTLEGAGLHNSNEKITRR